MPHVPERVAAFRPRTKVSVGMYRVVLTDVQPSSPADRFGPQVRDVITIVADRSLQGVLKKHDVKPGGGLDMQSGATKRLVFVNAEQ